MIYCVAAHDKYEVIEGKNSQEQLRYTLVIHNAQMDDFGPYNCSVQNSFGSDVLEIILNKKSEFIFSYLFTFYIIINFINHFNYFNKLY